MLLQILIQDFSGAPDNAERTVDLCEGTSVQVVRLVSALVQVSTLLTLDRESLAHCFMLFDHPSLNLHATGILTRHFMKLTLKQMLFQVLKSVHPFTTAFFRSAIYLTFVNIVVQISIRKSLLHTLILAGGDRAGRAIFDFFRDARYAGVLTATLGDLRIA